MTSYADQELESDRLYSGGGANATDYQGGYQESPGATRSRQQTEATEMSGFGGSDFGGAGKGRYGFLMEATNVSIVFEGLDCEVEVQEPLPEDPTKMRKVNKCIMRDASGVIGHPRRREIDDDYRRRRHEEDPDRRGFGKDGKKIRRSENTRSMTAMMGPSGSGKTTLMDMVATVKTLPFKGRITVNGADVVDNTQRVAVNVLDPNVVAFKRMVGYVEQQDIMNGGPPRPRGLNRAVPGLCTVKEALHFCVQLKPPRANPEEVRRLMEHGLNPEDDKDVVEEAYWEQDETGTLVEKRRPEGVLRYAEGGRYRLGQAGALDVIGKKMVCTVMKELGLEKVQDSLIGDEQVRGISGGQKKRVSIARALVSNPYLIFLDEPTSGLSAADAVTLIQQVKSLVDGLGIVAVSVIHQPRNRLFKMFDHLILLTGGRMVYQGPPKIDAKNYFDAVGFPLPQNTNPADHYIDYITESFNKDTPKLIDFFDGESKIVGCKEWVLQQVQKTRDEQAVSLDPSVTEMLAALENQLTTWEKVQVLAGREWTCLPRDQIKFTARIANAIFMGLLLGGIYADIEAKNIAAFAMICVEMPVIQSVASLPCLFRDRAFMHRERDTGLYTTTPFYLVTYLLSIVFSAITVFLQLVLTYGFTSLPWWPYFPMMYITCLTGFFMMDAVLFVIAYTGKDLDSAFLFFNFTLGIFMFSNGFTMNKVTSGDYINWLLYISPIFYSMSTVLNNFVHYGDYGDADEVEMIMTCDSGPGCLGLSGDNVFARNMFIMLALGVSLHAFAFYCARFMHRPQR